MINIKNKNKFLKISSILLIGVFAFFLAFMPFFLIKNKSDGVFAQSIDTVSSFDSGLFTVNTCSFNTFGNASSYRPLVDFSFNSSTDFSTSKSLKLRYYAMGYFYPSDSTYGYSDVLLDVEGSHLKIPSYSGLTSYSDNLDHGSLIKPRDNYYYLDFSFLSSGLFDCYFPFTFILSNNTSVVSFVHFAGDFNFGVPISYTISYSDYYNVLRDGTKNYYTIRYTFVDSNSSSFYLEFPSDQSLDWFSSFDRTYYYHSDLTDNEFYNQGYSDGYNTGNADGYNTGYNVGFDSGYSSGETSGYNDGIIAGSDVSFLNLIGATVDAPVKAFTGFFDFNINMGGSSFNLKGFFLALLSIAIVIAFVRLILAK